MTLLELATQWLDVITMWLIQPVLILLIGIFIGKVVQQVGLYLAAEFAPEVRSLSFVAYLLFWIISLTALGYALATVHVLVPLLWVIGSAIVLVLGLHLLLSLRDFLSNSARFGTAVRRWKPGTKLKTKYGVGTVVEVGITQTKIKTADGDDVYIPNRTLNKLKVEKV